MKLGAKSSRGWLDSLAISMSVMCAIHCLITPIIVAVSPILATTFWASENFHLWMMFFVIPTTGFALHLGCRKHKDKKTLISGCIGLALLMGVAIYESIMHSGGHSTCSQCEAKETGHFFGATTFVNLSGAFFLTTAHVRNFLLCRKSHCCH